MKNITFRPLRRIKKTGKICVASYMQWRKVKTADYSQFSLTINQEYKTFPAEEYVYNHKGEPLFWRDYNPADIPIIYTEVEELRNDDDDGLDYKRDYKNYPLGVAIFYSSSSHNAHYIWTKDLDCDGVPAFSHGTARNLSIGNMCSYTLDSVQEELSKMNEYEPLTVGIVVKWFGWFLYQLKNSQLQQI